jgi:hypothetical protein
VTNFYISPSYLSYSQYMDLIQTGRDFGWQPTWVWPQESFLVDAQIEQQLAAGAFNGIAQADIFITVLPGTPSTNIEIGIAYPLCEDLLLVANDPVHFTQTGLPDAHLSVLPSIKRVCCTVDEIPALLKTEYLYLIEKD